MSDYPIIMRGRATYDAGETTLVGVSLQKIGNEDATLEFLNGGGDNIQFGLLRLPDGQRIIAHMAWPANIGLQATLRKYNLCDRLFGKKVPNAIYQAQLRHQSGRTMNVEISDTQLQAHQEVIASYGG